MTTALVSDLHIGTRLDADVARRPEVRVRLAEALRVADHVVFLGDLVELRECAVAEVLELVAPVLGDLADALAGKRVTIVGGNHDHRLVEAAIERGRIEGAPLSLDWSTGLDGSPLAAALARSLPDSEVTVAYPGLRVRPDVFALHGHYLDLHMTVPRVESILGRAMVRRMLGRDPRLAAPDDYECALAPIYSLSYGLAQGRGVATIHRHNSISRDVWARTRAGGGAPLSGFLLGKLAIPAGVAALNLAGLGPFSPHLSGDDLRRSGLRAIAEVVGNLGIEAEHVVFGHTHRQGPLPGEEDDEGWRTPGGIRLWNTGSWFLESVLVGERRRESAYWPGGLMYVHDSGPPEPVNVLRDLDL